MITVQDDSNASLPTRSTLLGRLKEWNDSASWHDFFHSYNRAIYGIALKRGMTRVEAEEVVQETMVAVAQQMPDFTYDRALGSFKAWLFTIARRSIGKQLNKRAKSASKASDTESDEFSRTLEDCAEPVSGLEQQWDEEWRQSLMEMAMDRIRRKVKPKQFQMFDLYVNQQLPMEQVTRLLNVNSAQIYMAKMRILPLLRQEVANLEKQMI